MAKKLYIISNSHLDPVWIWNRRSGRTAWINTLHSVIRKMEEHPELKFTCSSAALYRWIEDTQPELFRKIAKYIENGRWEIVGGWEVQSDAIISRNETLLRQGISGKEYFQKKFGIDVNIGYCVDSFGHAAGLPKILNAVGLTHYVAMRPKSQDLNLPLLFDWKADDGSQVRYLKIFDAYNMARQTKEQYMKRIENHWDSPLEHQTLFFGMGDHGGGIYEKHMRWISEAQDKYDIVYSTLGEYFAATANEQVPVKTGELGRTFSGCYSVCREIKRQVAFTLDRLQTAEKLGVPASELEEAWKELLFNHFHDILPGTSIREAYVNDVYPGLGSAAHCANVLIDKALCRRDAAEDTSFMKEGGIFVRNTEPRKVRKIVSMTSFADPNENGVLFNRFVDKEGNVYPLQLLPAPTMFGPCGVNWGDLSTIIDLEPNEEKFLAYSWDPNVRRGEDLGFERQKKVLEKLGFQLFNDDHGTWGFNLRCYLYANDNAVLEKTEPVSNGPLASMLRATYRIRNSVITADIWAFAGVPEMKIQLKINYQEPDSCLKMTYAHKIHQCTFATGTVGGSVVRFEDSYGTVPGYLSEFRGMYPKITEESSMIDWCAVYSPATGESAAFYSPDHHGCDHMEGKLRLTLLRAALYADHHPFPKNEQSGYQDMGYTYAVVYLSEESGAGVENLPVRARKCLVQPEVLEVTGHKADPNALPGAECPPFVNELPAVVTESIHKNASGKWEVHLMNHGSDTELVLPTGEKLAIPAKKLVQFEL